jgi:uncharacterized membrane protein YbaN (DUF454 family)
MPRSRHSLLHRLRKPFLVMLGGLSVLLGAVTFWLPIPIGLPLVLAGTLLLSRNSARARLWLRPVRQRVRSGWRRHRGRVQR